MPTIPFPAEYGWYLGVIVAVGVIIVIKFFVDILP